MAPFPLGTCHQASARLGSVNAAREFHLPPSLQHAPLRPQNFAASRISWRSAAPHCLRRRHTSCVAAHDGKRIDASENAVLDDDAGGAKAIEPHLAFTISMLRRQCHSPRLVCADIVRTARKTRKNKDACNRACNHCRYAQHYSRANTRGQKLGKQPEGGYDARQRLPKIHPTWQRRVNEIVRAKEGRSKAATLVAKLSSNNCLGFENAAASKGTL
eukprot:6198571-Pleurochrysis_carterae.AAC.5